MFKHAIRGLVAAALLASTSGCYSLALNANDIRKPVSMTAQIGRQSTLLRHFKYDMITWYALGLVPVVTVPGAPKVTTPADQLVKAVLLDELNKGGDGIINLRVTQQANLISVATGIVLQFVPIVGQFLAAAVQPIGVIVEGDVVTFGRASLPDAPGMITERDGELDTNGVNLRKLVIAAVSEGYARREAERAAAK